LEGEYCCDPSDTGNPLCHRNTGTCAAPKTSVRITSANQPDLSAPSAGWWKKGQGGIYGWYFDLPGDPNDSNTSAERIIHDIIIRDGKIIATSFTPDTTECSQGGASFLYELDARTGARLKVSQLDISRDGRVNNFDMLKMNIDGREIWVAASGIGLGRGVANFGANSVLSDPDSQHGGNNNEYKIITSSDGEFHVIPEQAGRQGAVFWQEVTN